MQKIDHFFMLLIQDKEMAEKLKPNFKLGCKRILISDEYYKSMNDEKFELDSSPIQEIRQNGIETTEKNHDLDVIIYATGFNISANFDWLIKGRVDFLSDRYNKLSCNHCGGVGF